MLVRWVALLWVLCVGSSLSAQQPRLDYNFDVKPILSRRCFPCHGFDPSTREAKLRLDTFAGATKKRRKGAPIVPGDAAASRVIKRITDPDWETRMPPAEYDALTADEIATLTRWIDEGAEYAEHWSWLPIQDVEAPSVKDTEWCRDPIDQFVLARLERVELAPANEADRETWLRRVSLDIIGLPPTVAEIDAFLADDSATAHEGVVDRLLASHHFGERWGRHWLDLMRYAETYGHEYDYPIPHAYQYRDYVIRALNEGVPYDDFVTEHLAGDLLPEPRKHPEEGFNESVIGTGFWFLHQGTHAPVDVRQDELERIDNQIDVMTKSFLATTVSCARCHDHKFDAIPTKDYYGLMGFLQSSRQRELALYPDSVRPTLTDLERLHLQGRKVLAGIDPQEVGRQVSRELQAAHNAVFGPDHVPFRARKPIVFDDFEARESGELSYEGWTATGDAFGDAPQTLETVGSWQKVKKQQGRAFVNTHLARDGDNVSAADSYEGTLTSRTFTIELPRVEFRLSGGRHPKETCLNLEVSGEVVRSATGRNSNTMHEDHFDVREFIGKQARFVIVDKKKGHWGHIGVDDIRFVDRRAPLESATELATIAGHALDADRIGRWIDLMNSPAIRDPQHLMNVWHRGVSGVDANAGRDLESVATAEIAALSKRIEDAKAHDHEVFEDFDDGWDGWFTSGEAFGTAPTTRGDWYEEEGRVHLAGPGTASSGVISRQLHGSLRSPTFTISSKRLQYRVKGRGRIRVIIEGYTLDRFNPLIFKGMIGNVDTKGVAAWQELVGDYGKYAGHKAHIEIADTGDGSLVIDEIRFSDEPVADTRVLDGRRALLTGVEAPRELAAAIGAAVAKGVARWQRGQVDPFSEELLDTLSHHRLLPYPTEIDSTIAELRETEARLPKARYVLAIEEGTPENQPVYVRGSHRELGPEVERRFLTALADEQAAIDSGSGRLELAKRLLSDRNPLAARVAVNRAWHHLFGRGIVASTDDFGALGELPTHPQLLDFLAAWHRSDGEWSLKQLIRRLVLTSTYRMASHANDPRARDIDPTNALLHAMRVKRLQGEVIRDAMLAVSGRLDRTMFGNPVPMHLTAFLTGRGRPKKSGPLDGDGRRSIYLDVRRNFMAPMMAAFDTPVPMSAIGRRNVSNVPAQALMLLNDPFVEEQAKVWADRVVAATSDHAERIVSMYRSALGRNPTGREATLCKSFLSDQAELLECTESDPKVWAALGHVIFNVKDFVFVH